MESTADIKELTDAAIVQRVRGGENAAYAELVRRYHHRLRTVLSFYFGSGEEIEEYLQETFVQAYLHLTEFDSTAPLYPWLKSIALNLLKMEFRRLQTVRHKGNDYVRYIQLLKIDHDPEGSQIEPRAEALRQCLEKLPAEDGELVRERYFENAPVARIAQRLEVTEGSLKVRLLRLRHALRICIQRRLN